MKKMAPLFLTLALFTSSVQANEACVSYYQGSGVSAEASYKLIMAQLLMSVPMGMRMELLKEAKIAQSADISQVGPTQLETAFFMHMAKAYQEKTFDQQFDQIVAQLFQLPQLQAKAAGLPAAKKDEMVMMLKKGILGEIQLRNYYGKSFDTDIWSKMARNLTRIMKKVKNWFGLSAGDKLSKIAELINENNLGKVQMAGTEQFEYLIDGPASFKKRDEMIERAKKSIHVLTWSVYDDATGIKFANQMIHAKQVKKLDVKIIVDALTAQKQNHREQLARMKANGVEVIYSSNPKLALSGQHRKAMIVDGAEVVAGGLNYGDVYSHLAGNVKWRDTDAYFTGSLAHQTENLFINEWNEQIHFAKEKQKRGEGEALPYSRMEKIAVVKSDTESKAIMINSNPASQHLKGSPILASLLALIKSSKEEIIIENAYIISNPILEATLKEAIDRGVRVTIITNSSKSVDEPVISNPILASALRLKKLGATIVLKKGDTLHSKVAVFDGQISLITSYNIHPRSEIIEDEMAYVSADLKGAQSLRQALINDIRENTTIVDDSEIVLSNDPLMMFVNRIFYNQL